MTLVIKIGGGAEQIADRLLEEIAEQVASGEQVVVVHGGSRLTSQLSERLGHPPRILTSPGGFPSRYTDRETLRIYAMAVAGEINTALVARLQALGVNALGLAGVAGRLLVARRKAQVRSVTPEGRTVIVRDDYTGRVEEVNAGLLRLLLAARYTPIVAPLALSREGERLNVDGDRAAAAIAGALGAQTLAIITDVPGLLRQIDDPTSVIRTIATADLESNLRWAHGRMSTKLLGAREALAGGVERVCIGSDSLVAVLSGAGTTIAADAALREEVSVGNQ